eukprot:765456-Hanusia_phi.AAC.10
MQTRTTGNVGLTRDRTKLKNIVSLSSDDTCLPVIGESTRDFRPDRDSVRSDTVRGRVRSGTGRGAEQPASHTPASLGAQRLAPPGRGHPGPGGTPGGFQPVRSAAAGAGRPAAPAAPGYGGGQRRR